MRKLWTLFLLFTLVCSSTLATASEYEIILDPDPEMDMYRGGATTTLSFWELPLSLQAVYISGLLGASLVVYKFLPLLLGRIKQKYENPNRDRILYYITTNPGSTISDIEKALGMKRSNVRYHLKVLQFNNKITRLEKGKLVLLFKNSCKYTATEKKIIFFLRNDTGKSILIYILHKPGITNQDLTQTFHLDKGTVHWHINDMYNEGLVDFENDGKYKRYFINPAIEVDLKKAISESEPAISAS
ncbi:winged helix-turn-helix transcriptional regulator [Methanococcoides burtonii]|uniref:ArsR family transcriptional regulator n=1 Tax=Methanococcoides burtonii (strain DSM 6242 / NBRC 107633 / OCM 468 / ACE-M) TaxID=259564 RepID=Q12V23_METBU|nr:winged helix-turn-helix transcriptional regulator [Methanococcoides burtonii]ABE52703.1 ArsR family transcriptional regulator [Methanococcoides burtonii DSM 6242]